MRPMRFWLSLTAASALTSGLVPATALSQVVADRVLSDVKTRTIGTCSTVTITFNIRVQMLSYFPTTAGRELHIRIQPLDGGALSRESLRTPAGVPSLRSIEYEGDNPAGPVLSLFFNKNTSFTVSAGNQPQSITIIIGGDAATCEKAAPDVTAPVPVSGTEQPAKPQIPVPAGLYIVNLLSQPKMFGDITPAQRQLAGDKLLYDLRFERDAQTWHQLRLGFFESREDAEAARRKILAQYPEAWVAKVTANERQQAVTSPLYMSGVQIAAGDGGIRTATAEDAAAVARLRAEAEEAIKTGENDRAIQILTKALSYPETPDTARSLELLGLMRERKGQAAHATAEYEEYLRRYPEGEAADRVRQRLAAIKAGGGEGTQQALRAPTEGGEGERSKWTWGARGSFSQFYFRDQSSTRFVDAKRPDPSGTVDDPTVVDDSSVNLNQLLTSADVTISTGNGRNQVQLRASGSYSKDFRSNGKDIEAVSALYLDVNDNEWNVSARLGRQTRNSAGVLGRFDGGLFGWQASRKVRVNLVAGFPVLSSRQKNVLTDRPFYGASVGIGAKSSPLQTTVYWFDQRSHGFIDRQAAGIEARYFTPKFNAYGILDYDVKYSKLNLGLLTLNYTFEDTSSLSMTADYRQSPLLTTHNALIGQVDPITFDPILNLQDLQNFYSDSQIYQLALDRTMVAKSLTLSYSRPLTKKLQTNFDFTLTDTGGTPASGGVDAMDATGTEYFYGAQLIGSGLFWANDIYILSGRYSDTQRAHSYSFDLNARVPVTGKLRISPRARYGYRTDKLIDSKFQQIQPTLRINYYPIRHSELEIEFGGNFSKQRSSDISGTTTTTEKGFLLNAGYRLDF